MRVIDFDYLQKYISEGALHDSIARFPTPRCHPQTREKVLKIITDWVNDPHPQQPIIWLNGPAGGGKSAIAQTIAGRCSGEQLAASFFFLRNSPDRGTATRLYTTLAWQLANNIPELLSYIESAIRADPLFPTKSPIIQFDCLIVQPLQKIYRDKPNFCPQKFLVIIDGVDECAPHGDQKVLLELIGGALSEIHFPLRFLICSRLEPHLQEVFKLKLMAGITHAVSLHDQFEAGDDIRRYLEDEFTRIRAEHTLFKLPPGWPSGETIDQLVSKSSGQFIYASTIVKFVDDIDPREQLDIVLKTRLVNSVSPFAELDQLYVQILSQQPNIRLLRDIFTLIIALRNPKIEFVCRRLRIREGQLERKLLKLHSLVHISDGITTYHLSLHDFFLDKKRAGKYFIHPIRVTCVRLPEIMIPARENTIRLLLLFGQLIGFCSFAALVYGIPSKLTNLPVTPRILLFLLIQSAVMNYLTFVNGLLAYLIMTFLAPLTLYLLTIGRMFNFVTGGSKHNDNLLLFILSSSHITAMYLLIYQFVSLLSQA